ncbi:response regulator transcription factor [Harryflintia acetispora]|uniref:response regulator transcription factor n=1 Tax=Harryflintia acetispora TaxID=1849041 RepID=UPI00189AD374|nr:response regulator [Harryflintia acetispora]
MKCRIFLVEDEYETRQSIHYLVDWAAYGFEIAGEAANGQQALELIAQARPHIVLTDIRMPQMDGVELTKTLQMRFPDIRVIVLSGYSDFEYVRDCFQYGAVDYVLKPTLQADELLTLLERIASKIPSCHFVPSFRPTAESLLGLLLAGMSENLAADPGPFFPGPQYRLLAMDVPYVFDKAPDLGRCCDLLRKAAQECFSGRCTTVAEFENRRLVLLINTSAEFERRDAMAARRVAVIMKHSLGDSFWVYSDAIGHWSELYQHWKNGYAATLKQRFYHHKDYFIEEASLRTGFQERVPWDVQHFSALLEQGRMLDALDAMVQYTRDILSTASMEELKLKALLSNIVYQIIDYLEEAELPLEHTVELRRNLIVRISNTRFSGELLQLTEQLAEELQQYCIVKKKPSEEMILDYVETHYAQQLSLYDLAKQFSFNYHYLSAYFTTHYQKSFTEYLNTVRIQKAQQLLQENILSVAEVGAQVGYTDNSYFSRVFKKSLGVTPTAYRKQYQKRQR